MKYLPLMAITGLMAGCSSVNSITDTTNLVDYSNHKSVKLLEVPADLDKPVFSATSLMRRMRRVCDEHIKIILILVNKPTAFAAGPGKLCRRIIRMSLMWMCGF